MTKQQRFNMDLGSTHNTFVFVRHGQTAANLGEVCMGRLDYELSQVGIAQAEAIAHELSPDALYVSPLKRVIQTAQIILRNLDLPYSYEVDELLIERSGGELEGLTYAEIKYQYAALWEPKTTVFDERISLAFPGGESEHDVIERLERFLATTNANHTDHVLYVITHSGVIQAARYLFGESYADTYNDPVKNCSPEIYYT